MQYKTPAEWAAIAAEMNENRRAQQDGAAALETQRAGRQGSDLDRLRKIGALDPNDKIFEDRK